MIGEEQMNAPLRADFQGSGTSQELRTASMASSFLRRANSARAVWRIHEGGWKPTELALE
jgi:hypothetical protein